MVATVDLLKVWRQETDDQLPSYKAVGDLSR